jgi:outer membrane lipoprotein SlyB
MGKLIKTKIKLRMKNQMRILAILLFAISITGCSNGNKNSSQEIENSEAKVIDDSSQLQSYL